MTTGGEEERMDKVEYVSASDLPCRVFVVNRILEDLDYPGFPKNAREMVVEFGPSLEIASRHYGMGGPACTLTTFELFREMDESAFAASLRNRWRTLENRCSVDLLRRTLKGSEAESLLAPGPTLFFSSRDAPRTSETSFPLYFEFSRSRKNKGCHWYEVEVYREGALRVPRAGSKGMSRRIHPAPRAKDE